jgi:hypothetical protein
MIFGRPTMTSHDWSVELPELIDDEYLIDNNPNFSDCSDGRQPASVRPKIGCFRYTLKLCSIKDDILLVFYITPKIQILPTEFQDQTSCFDFTTMIEFDRRLNEFETTLPSWLRSFDCQESLGTSAIESCVLQVNVLRAR